jgi:DNA replication protein DnaC
MERHEILEAMSELKLHGMRASFDEIAGKGLARRNEIYPLIASLIRAERTHRQARSISYRIGGAKFPVLKDIDTFTFADTPIDEGQVRELAAGTFLDAKRNAIFIGGTGTGKTHLCIAVASAVIRARARGASLTWSIWSISWSRRRPPVAADGWPRSCCATISSSSTNSAICRSVSPADSCCST